MHITSAVMPGCTPITGSIVPVTASGAIMETSTIPIDLSGTRPIAISR